MKTSQRIVLAVWLLQTVNYMERVVVGFAAPSMMQSFGMSPQTFGIVLSAFAVGYFLAQLPGGLVADRWGAKAVLVIGPLAWAFFTGITALADTVAALVVVRLLFGISEGLSTAAIYKVLGDGFDVKTRARATSVWVAAFAVAPAFTGPLVGMLLASLDWRWVFLVLAFPALAVAAVNGRLLPKTGNTSGSSEPSYDGLAPLPMKQLLAMPSLWLAGGAFAFWNVAYWGLLGWMPSYLSLERHLDIKSSGLLSGIPYAFGLAGVVVSGWLGSGLLLRYRPYLLGGSHLAAAAALTLSYTAGSVTGSLVGLSVAAFFIYCGLSTYCTLVVDLAPRMARAAFSGAASTLGQVGSVAAPAIIGYLVSHTGTFSAGFALMSCSLLAASACAFALSPLNRSQVEPAVLTRT